MAENNLNQRWRAFCLEKVPNLSVGIEQYRRKAVILIDFLVWRLSARENVVGAEIFSLISEQEARSYKLGFNYTRRHLYRLAFENRRHGAESTEVN